MFLQENYTIPIFGGKIGAGHKAKIAKYKNDIAFQNAFSLFVEDASFRYGIDGLPDTCDERVVLQSLLWYGCVCIFDENDSLFSLPAAPVGGLNLYGNTPEAWIYARNGYLNKKIKVHIKGSNDSKLVEKNTFGLAPRGEAKGVLIWENINRYPFIRHVMQYAEAVADTMRTLDVARVNIKTPYVIAAEESVVSTVREFFNKRDNNEDAIISSGIFDPKKISLMPIQTTSENLKACTQLIEWYRAQFKELCAFKTNTQLDKKGENLTQAELNSNADYIAKRYEETTYILEECLQEANEFFGLNLKLRVKEEIVYDNEDIQTDKGKSDSISSDDT